MVRKNPPYPPFAKGGKLFIDKLLLLRPFLGDTVTKRDALYFSYQKTDSGDNMDGFNILKEINGTSRQKQVF